MIAEYLGTTQIPSQANNFLRTYHLWGYVELGGELTAFHYNTSSDFMSASGDLRRADCKEEPLKTLWDAAEYYAQNAEFDDYEVIEAFEPGDEVQFPSFNRKGVVDGE